MTKKFYAAKSKSMEFETWAVWQRVSRDVRVQLLVVTAGGRDTARHVAHVLNALEETR